MLSRESMLIFLADAILILHFLFVCFVVFGLLAIYVGHFRQWCWVRNRTFRIVHLMAISIVVLQAWLGVICPLTAWEMALRAEADTPVYAGSFIQHWLQQLLYFEAPAWVFILLYTGFGGLVLLSWFRVQPNPSKRHRIK